MKNKIILSILVALGLAAVDQANAQTKFVDVATLGDGVSVATSSGTVKVNATVLTKNQTWTRDQVYIVGNNVIIPNGITLNIQAGTIVRFERHTRGQGSGAEAAVTPADTGALVVSRGGVLNAIGTAEAAIYFTSIDDILVPGGESTVPPIENKGVVANGTTIVNGERILKTGYTVDSGVAGVGTYTITGGTLTAAARGYSTTWSSTADSAWKHDGMWGGIVMAGKSTVNRGYGSGVNARTTVISEPTINVTTGALTGTQAGVQLIEGMAGFSAYSWGGGDEESDTSGVLRFIVNNGGGFVIALDTELNAFSFVGVGRNTTVEYCEAFNNADDDFETWGSDMNLTHIISAFCGDDGIDTDQGYLGNIQFACQIQNNAIGTDGVSVSGRSTSNYGDSVTENDGPESNNSAVPYSTYTLANATMIGRGYGAASYAGTGPFSGPNHKDNAGCRVYNSLFMDSPHGAVLIMDRVTSPTDNTFSSAGNSSINRYTGTRTSGGFDAAGRASDLVTADNGPASGPDGLFNNTWFFRNGYADSTVVGVNGMYATKALFDAAVNNLPATTAANRFPDSTDKSGRGTSANGTTGRANTAAVQAEITKAANYNVFDQNPGVSVNPYHRLSGIDLRVTDSTARNLPNSSLPSYRGLNSDATFVGAVRDSMWMRGWTRGDTLGMYSGPVIVPDVSLSVNGLNQAVVTFGGEAGVKYVVEVSRDNKAYTKVATVTAVAGNNSVTDPTGIVGTAPIFYRATAL
jgi:hypothetical protein